MQLVRYYYMKLLLIILALLLGAILHDVTRRHGRP